MFSARTRTRTARSEDERTNHEATAPHTSSVYLDLFFDCHLHFSPELFVQVTLFLCIFSRPQQRGKGESVRRDGGSNPKPPSYLSRHAKYTPASLAKEARDTVKSVKALIEEERK